MIIATIFSGIDERDLMDVFSSLLEVLCFLTQPLTKFLYCFLESMPHVSLEKFPHVVLLNDLFVRYGIICI